MEPENQNDIAQRSSILLPTTTEITTFNTAFSSVTYYIRKIRSSFISVFVAAYNGVKNGTYYEQGHLILTKDQGNQTTAFIKDGNFLIHPKENEVYSIDEQGHLICTTTEIT